MSQDACNNVTHLRCEDIELRIGYQCLMSHVNLQIDGGMAVGIMGPNGAGKTTLLRCLAGLTHPHSGRIWKFGSQFWPKVSSAPSAPNGFLVYFASQPAFFRDLPVINNLHFLCQAYGVFPNPNELNHALMRVGLAERRLQTSISLSTGQKRRLTLAAALLIRPQMLIFDEPTNGLDTEGLLLFSQIIDEALKQKSSVLIATHDVELLKKCNDILDISSFLPRKTKGKTFGTFS